MENKKKTEVEKQKETEIEEQKETEMEKKNIGIGNGKGETVVDGHSQDE